MRGLRFILLALALAASAGAAVVEAPIHLALPTAVLSAPAAVSILGATPLSAPSLSFLPAPVANIPSPGAPSAAPVAAAPAPAPVALAAGAEAPALPELETTTRALLRRYVPHLYHDLNVRYMYEESKFGSGGGHSFDPATGHEIAMTPGEADADGNVFSAIGERDATKVQPKIEQIVTSVHEFAHALFDEAVRRPVAERPSTTSYDAMTEGFAVKVERLVMQGMIRDQKELGLSARDVSDLRNILDARARWLESEDTPYAEGTPVWHRLHSEGGEEAMAAFLGNLKADRMMAVMRADPIYQLSLGSPETAGAYLDDGAAPLRPGLEAAGAAAKGVALSPSDRDAAARAADAAGPNGRAWLIRRALARESDFGDSGEPMWIVPAFLRRADDMALALFRLAAVSPALAQDVAAFLHAAATRPDGMARLLEERGATPRLMTIAAEAEKLPWTEAARKAWNEALLRWIAEPAAAKPPL
jgi:hypothetical protein